MKHIRVIFGALSLLIGAGDVSAARLTGQLKGSQVERFKVVAIARNARSVVAPVARSGKFRISASRNATLHLIQDTGRYFGPVVLASGKRALPKVTGKSGNLGKLKVKAGFAAAQASPLNRKLFDNKAAIPFNRTTGPKGAGKFGLVRTTAAFHAADLTAKDEDAKELGEDTDDDGLPDLLDLDDDGDLILDIVDGVPHQPAEFEAETTSTLRLSLTQPLNANISGLSRESIDQMVSDNLILGFFVRNNGAKTVTSVDVDCSNLSYCKSDGGSATLRIDNGPLPEDSLWTSYDPDGNQLPNLYVRSRGHNVVAEMGFHPHATTTQLRPGDTVVFKLTTSGGTAELPAILPFFFITSPTLVRYDDGAGFHDVSYPVAFDGKGTYENPIELQNGSVTFTFWKPQRLPIEGAETGSYIDIGGLKYNVSASVEGSDGVYVCRADEYSTSSPGLSVLPDGQGAVLKDSAADAPADPSTVLNMTINLSACLARQGLDTAGKRVMLALQATSDAMDQTSQWVNVKMP